MDEFPKRGLYLVQSTSDEDRYSLGGFGATGLKDVLIVDRFSPLSVGDFTEQQASNDPAFWHLERPRRDVCTIQQIKPPLACFESMAVVGFKPNRFFAWIVRSGSQIVNYCDFRRFLNL